MERSHQLADRRKGARLARAIALLVFSHVSSLPVAAPAAAQERIELTPVVGFRALGTVTALESRQTLELDPGLAYGLILNYTLRPTRQLELTWTRQETAFESNNPPSDFEFPLDLTIDHVQFGGLYQWGERKVKPFIRMTAGGSWFDPERAGLDGELLFSGSFGGGYKVPISERVAVRLEGRGHGTFIGSGGGLFCSSAGSGAACGLSADGSTILQIEGLIGLTFRP
jgi:hypothetical protein